MPPRGAAAIRCSSDGRAQASGGTPHAIVDHVGDELATATAPRPAVRRHRGCGPPGGTRAAPPARPPRPWAPGITAIIPERDAPSMLAATLAALFAALDRVDEPRQVVVVANGAPRAAYAEVAARFPGVEWVHSDAPLAFTEAVARGLARARHDGTYLLNNDMTLDGEALAELVRWRAPDVFAIASQILQRSADGRREETGFTDWYADRGGVHLYHAPVPSAPGVVPHLCASGGAALFRTAPLAAYVRASRCYDPFYWEDAEWGLRAWRDGWRVLYCPASRATHAHRATTTRFYAPDELARIVERNRWLFDARHGATGFGAAWLLARACDLPYASQRELAQPRQAAGVLRQRLARRRARPPPPPRLSAPDVAAVTLAASSYSYRLRAMDPARARLLVVSPFAVLPPRHGGARRVAELMRGLTPDFDVVLVTDEASLYDARSFAGFDGLAAVDLVQRREHAAPDAPADPAQRMRTHCHPDLVAAVDAALVAHRPHIVQVEYAELAPLVRRRVPGARWVLDLHDAYGPGDFATPEDARVFARDLAAYDALVVCSDEDRGLLAHPRIACVPNGSRATPGAYVPSEGVRLLFVGPFRYAANRDGIARFLRDAWPAVRARVPQATLLVLAGDEHPAFTRDDPLFAQAGVTVSGHRDDVAALLAGSALSINPQLEIRGSAVKLVESLAAGRVCVSTRAGARGFAAASPALVTATDVAAMAEPIAALLADPARRHALETPAPGALAALSWERSVALQRALCDVLLREPPSP
ncbi:MAG: glycosyltransferase [Burkholderiales bacterium]